MDWSKVSAELAKPLNKAHVKPAKAYGPKGDYIEAWHAQSEANRIFGAGGWAQEVIERECVAQGERPIGRDKKPGWGVTYIAKVRVTVDGVVREDFGAGHGYDMDLGLAHESAIKEAVSDAMKRALKSFGNPFGLALYDKTRANVTDHEEERERRNAQKQDNDARRAAETREDDASLIVSGENARDYANKVMARFRDKGAVETGQVLQANQQWIATLPEPMRAEIEHAASIEGAHVRAVA